jgi:5-formaminoimidazole-4-carboxamide-1-beta-D-ribofuranosyl 5'-monophosphate synthetase
MELYRISIPKDDAWKVIEKIGEDNFAHFVDLNKNEKVFNLPYAYRIKMCDETERRIQYLLARTAELKVPCYRPKDELIQNTWVMKLAETRNKSRELLFDSIEQDIVQKEQFVMSQNKIIDDMRTAINK